MIVRTLVLLAVLATATAQECTTNTTTVLTLTPTITPVTQPPFPGLSTLSPATSAPTPGGQLTTNENFDPTSAPTSAPEESPLSTPAPTTPDCIPNVQYLPDDLDFGAVEVLSQDGTKVTFGVSQAWSSSPICLLGVDYLSPDSNQDECDVHDTVLPGEVGKYTAKCYNGYADITVYLQDAMFTAASPATVVPLPRCGPIESEGPNTISYEVRIPCMPECEPMAPPQECDGSENMPIVVDEMTGDGWLFGIVEDGYLTAEDDEEMVKTYSVPLSAVAVQVTIDMIELTDLTEEFIRIGDTYMSFGDFSPSTTEEPLSSTVGDVDATVEPFGPNADRITLVVPIDWFPEGRLTIAFGPGVGVETVALESICSLPTAPPASDCVSDILYTTEDFDYPPVEILAQDGATVTFGVSQTWSDSHICLLGVDYLSAGLNTLTCEEEDTVPPGEVGAYTAKCVNGYADITIYLQDIIFDPVALVDVPSRCSTITSRGPNTVKYDVRIPCEVDCVVLEEPPTCDGSADMELVDETFDDGEASTWFFGRESTTPSGSKCLKPMTGETSKTYPVPLASVGVILRFTFEEENDIDGEFMRVQDVYFDVGSFFTDETDEEKAGFLDDVWVVVTPIDDVMNEVMMVIPSSWYPGGRLTVAFDPQVCVDQLALSSICSGSITDVPGYGASLAPTSSPTADCIPNIIFAPEPSDRFPAIELISQDTTSVTFGVSQTFSDEPICLLGVDYFPADGNQDLCDVHDLVLPGEVGVYKAKCINGWAEISVYAQDAILTGNGAAVSGLCTPIVSQGPNTVGYDVRVPCIPECDPIPAPPVCNGSAKMPVYSETFDAGVDDQEWFGGLAGTAGTSKYMYTDGGEAVLTVSVPKTAKGLTIRFDMVELQNISDEFVRIKDTYIDLGAFNMAVTDSAKQGSLGSGLYGSVAPTATAKDTVTLTIPPAWYADGRLTVAFGPGVGIDSLVMEANCSA